MSISLKGCKFEHTELSIHFESFNDECAIVEYVLKRTEDGRCPERKSVESGIKTNARVLTCN